MSQTPLFRTQAIEHQRTIGNRAELVVLDPAATSWGFRLLCAGMVACVAFVAIGRVSEYAIGPAFVQLDGRVGMVAKDSGLVTSVRVRPGDRVSRGDELVRFDASEERSQFEAASQQFESQLAKLLLRPDDPVTREALVALRASRELARQRRERRVVRAPHDGIVGDVRVHEGQLVDPGLRMLDLQGEVASASITALLPGRYRPLLHRGDRLRFEIDGFHRLTHELEVSRVGAQIVGPSEAARFVGRDLAGAIPINGPVVLVQAELPKASFAMDGEHYDFSSGMLGKAEVVVRNEPIAYTLLPTLKQWTARARAWARELATKAGWE
ncbi:MAG: HlyD family efflux transporter periplasmic adaptor subunit [Myxococcales bacterium]|nr:HlyD family efflux transporter periplasmic adaptor subunit [Myxococcales bacterium]